MPRSLSHPWPNGGNNGKQRGKQRGKRRAALFLPLLILIGINLSACAMKQPPAPGPAHPARQHPAPETTSATAWAEQPLAGVRLADQLDFAAIMAQLTETRVFYLGESHDRYHDHLLQLRIIKALHRQNPKLAIGMEMFARPRQPVLDAYLAGKLDEAEFLRQSGWFKNWGFDYRLYREIIDFAREQGLPLIALNLEKGLTGKVFRQGGWAALNEEERRQLPLNPEQEADLTLPGYRERIKTSFAHHQEAEKNAELFEHFLQAQALWDETMAATAAAFLGANPDYRLAVVVGKGHTDKQNAIPPRVSRRLPVVQAVILPGGEELPDPKSADYLIFTPPATLSEPVRLGVMVGDYQQAGTAGAEVSGLSPHGPAEKAGIKEKDVITGLNEQAVGSAEELKILLFYRQKGESAQIRIRRPGDDGAFENLTIPVTF